MKLLSVISHISLEFFYTQGMKVLELVHDTLSSNPKLSSSRQYYFYKVCVCVYTCACRGVLLKAEFKLFLCAF